MVNNANGVSGYWCSSVAKCYCVAVINISNFIFCKCPGPLAPSESGGEVVIVHCCVGGGELHVKTELTAAVEKHSPPLTALIR